MQFVNIAGLTNPDTGRTFREENNAKQHVIPLGTLVEVKFDEWFRDGACWKVHARLWVVKHTRDCDGTPLYSLSRWTYEDSIATGFGQIYSGFGEESLTPVEVTQALKDGEGALEWDDPTDTP